MAKTKVQKQVALEGLQQKMGEMKSAVFVNFSGIPVKEINELRNSCKDENINYTVAKKTLLKKVLTENGFKGVEEQNFDGEIATLVSTTDEVAPARLVSKFAKTHDKMKIVGGVLEKDLIDGQKVIELSKLPSKQELIASVVGTIAAPLSGMLNVLQGNLRNFVYVLNAIKDKK